MSVELYVGNRSPSLTDTIRANGSVVDLSSSTVKLQMRAFGATTLKVDTGATVTDASSGAVRYDWAAADVDTAGDYQAWWRVTTGGLDQDTPEFLVQVREHGPRSSVDLVTLGQVREALQSVSGEDADDELLSSMISRASVAVMKYTQREFAPASSSVTRRFRVTSDLVDLAPYDLRTATTVTLHPLETSPDVLVANSDYMLEPVMATDGVYNMIRLSSTTSLNSSLMADFGVAFMDVEGDWGWSSVPEDVQHATIATVMSWYRKDAAALDDVRFDIADNRAPQPVGGFSLPAAVRHRLMPYRRVVVA